MGDRKNSISLMFSSTTETFLCKQWTTTDFAPFACTERERANLIMHTLTFKGTNSFEAKILFYLHFAHEKKKQNTKFSETKNARPVDKKTFLFVQNSRDRKSQLRLMILSLSLMTITLLSRTYVCTIYFVLKINYQIQFFSFRTFVRC